MKKIIIVLLVFSLANAKDLLMLPIYHKKLPPKEMAFINNYMRDKLNLHFHHFSEVVLLKNSKYNCETEACAIQHTETFDLLRVLYFITDWKDTAWSLKGILLDLPSGFSHTVNIQVPYSFYNIDTVAPGFPQQFTDYSFDSVMTAIADSIDKAERTIKFNTIDTSFFVDTSGISIIDTSLIDSLKQDSLQNNSKQKNLSQDSLQKNLIQDSLLQSKPTITPQIKNSTK